MGRFVLVHGAWSGGWVWERVTPLLEEEGHTVDAVDLPGHGANPAAPGEMTLEAYSRHVADRVEAAGGPVVLVGHSMGGMSITGAAELVPDRIETLVYVTAFLPNDGQSLPELAAGNPDELVQANIVVDEASGLCTVREEVQRDAFYGECSAEDAAWGTAHRGVGEPGGDPRPRARDGASGPAPCRGSTSSAPATARSRSTSSAGCGPRGRAGRC